MVVFRVGLTPGGLVTDLTQIWTGHWKIRTRAWRTDMTRGGSSLDLEIIGPDKIHRSPYNTNWVEQRNNEDDLSIYIEGLDTWQSCKREIHANKLFYFTISGLISDFPKLFTKNVKQIPERILDFLIYSNLASSY